jgi:hypothetical protein
VSQEAAGAAIGWVAFQEHWHEFFLMTGTAAVTLAGLLFVALSIHIDTLIHASRVHLLRLARAILISYVMVLTFSLMMLVPGLGMRVVAVEMVAIGMVFLVFTARQMRTADGVDHPEFPHRLFRRRLIPMLVGSLVIGLSGLGMLWLRVPEFFYLIIGAFCMLLGNATGASLDLLVRTARLRRDAAAAADADA